MTLGDWLVSAFVENLLNSHTVTNYQLGSADYSTQPRTTGITATQRMGGK